MEPLVYPLGQDTETEANTATKTDKYSIIDVVELFLVDGTQSTGVDWTRVWGLYFDQNGMRSICTV